MVEEIWTLYFDGACKGNGQKDQKAGGGFCLVDHEGKPKLCGYKYFGNQTNNQSEYGSLIHALEEIKKKEWSVRLDIKGDSKLVCQQVLPKKKGGWDCRKIHLIPLRDKVRQLMNVGLDTISHIPREINTLADYLSNVAVDNKDERVIAFDDDCDEVLTLAMLKRLF